VLALNAWQLPAQAAQPEELAVIRNLWERARLAETEGRWKDCERDLSEAVALVATPGLLYHLAYCKEQQHQWVEAIAEYRRAEQLIRSGVEAADVEELLHATLARLGSEIPTLTLQVEELPVNASLYIGGQQYATDLLGKPIALNPGSRTIQLAAPGCIPVSQDVNLVPGETRTLHLVLTREAPRPLAAAPVSPTSAKPYIMIGEAGLALAGIGAGVVFGVEQSAHLRDQQSYLGSKGPSDCAKSPDPMCEFARHSFENAQIAQRNMWIGLSVAGVGVVAFFGTWWFWPSTSHKPTQVALVPEANGLRAVVSGSF
jgi:hypothetical protein